MNNKGFTLIELVAIVLVVAAIFMVSFPSLLNLSKKDEERKYDSMVENLCLAGDTYIKNNEEDFKNMIIPNNKIEVEINELMAYGIVKYETKNPKTNKSVENDKLIYTVQSDKSLNCQYKES
ncbi:MAG: type II secretion system protein [Bacilli bacterium]|nr:type II secretion system protein [Bacilli bacterium]